MDLLTKLTNFIMPPVEDEFEEEEEEAKVAAKPAQRSAEVVEQKVVNGAPVEYAASDYEVPAYRKEPEVKSSRPQLTVHTTKQASLKIKVYEPDSFEQVTRITDDLKDKKAVVVNFEKVDAVLQRRVCDFVNGACYVLDGDARRITGNIVLYVPEGVDLSDDVAMSLAQ